MKISVIIPAYNAAHCLRRCLDTVFGQSQPPYQVIVVNDGSTDDTASIAQQYCDRIVYREQANAGQGAARNVGLDLAHGDAVAFLDADDYWRPAFLESTAGFLEAHPETVAVSTAITMRYLDGSERLQPAFLREDDAPTTPRVLDHFFRFWADHDHIRTGTALIRRETIEEAGPQRADLRMSQDLEYWGYIATFGPWGFIPEPCWVGDSRRSASRLGWRRRYRKRRRRTPTVESWQKRIVPRLQPDQRADFARVRGRLAAIFAYNHVLAGHSQIALQIVRKYGDDMPASWSTRLLRFAARLGPGGWLAGTQLLKAKELGKHLYLQFKPMSHA